MSKFVLMRPSPMTVLWIKAACRMNRKEWNAAWLSITVLRQARQRNGDDARWID